MHEFAEGRSTRAGGATSTNVRAVVLTRRPHAANGTINADEMVELSFDRQHRQLGTFQHHFYTAPAKLGHFKYEHWSRYSLMEFSKTYYVIKYQ
ncbi:unnamed protein product, partial [Iphiclides podalirius]